MAIRDGKTIVNREFLGLRRRIEEFESNHQDREIEASNLKVKLKMEMLQCSC
jgi:hypothetical protein